MRLMFELEVARASDGVHPNWVEIRSGEIIEEYVGNLKDLPRRNVNYDKVMNVKVNNNTRNLEAVHVDPLIIRAFGCIHPESSPAIL
jgi:hypothetical protein